MRRRRSTIWWREIVPLVWLAVTAGCRLPAIDPTGEQLFLPPPAYTTLATPCNQNVPPPSWYDCKKQIRTAIPCLPKPAFEAPPPPPPCDASGNPPPDPAQVCETEEGPNGPRLSDGLRPGVKFGRIVLTPARIVAPVGTEVVLMAGLCDPAGYYVVKQPIEWVMSQESVGNIVDVGEPGYCLAPPMFNGGTKKYGADFVIGRTVAKTATFTRGTAQLQDDFTVKRGQSWISVTSPSEGVSHVTAWAPNSQAWDLRRQTATIHWVDAQWALPPPAIVPSGQRQVIRTKVTRTSGAAAKGWFVHYEAVEGPPVAFANGQPAIDVPVNANGDAVAELAQTSAAGGTSKILVQIIRPGQLSGEPSRIVIGHGYTTVTWSAPALSVNVTGPVRAAIDEVMSFQVDVGNPGDLPASNIVLRDIPPPIFEFLNSSPNGQPMGDYAQWNLGTLGPHETIAVVVNVRGKQNGNARYCFRANADNNLEAQGCAPVTIFSSTLSLRVSGPETAEVGQTVEFLIEIENTGTTPLANVALVDRFDPGLRHAEGQASPIEKEIGDLQPGQKIENLAVNFVVTAPGRHCHTMEVSADGGHRATAQKCITGVEAAQAAPPPAELPKIEARKSGPTRMKVGELGVFTVEVRNTGNIPATNLRIIDRYGVELKPTRATDGATQSEGDQAVAWNVRELAPGATISRRVECRAVSETQSAINEATISSSEGARVTTQATTLIEAATPSQPMDLNPPTQGGGELPATGQLSVVVAALNNPIRVGQRARFLITVKNERNVSDRNITVTAEIPENVAIETLRGPGVQGRTSGRRVTFDPLQELRPGEPLSPYEIELVPRVAGPLVIKVTVESQRLGTQKLEKTGEIDIQAP